MVGLELRALASFLEGRGDLVSSSVMGIIRVTTWVLEVVNLITKSP